MIGDFCQKSLVLAKCYQVKEHKGFISACVVYFKPSLYQYVMHCVRTNYQVNSNNITNLSFT